MREPFVSEAVGLLGDQALIMAHPGAYYSRELMISTPQFIARRGEAVVALMRAMMDAEEFVEQNPRQAMANLAAALGVDVGEIEPLWAVQLLHLNLPQGLLRQLEIEADWALAHNLAEGLEPNFFELLDWRALEEVHPEAVTIIR